MNTINLHTIKNIELEELKVGTHKRYTIRTKDVHSMITEIHMIVPSNVEILIKNNDKR